MKRMNFARSISTRRGAVLPMFAFLLPVFVILCGLAINVSYMRLARTELKIASDATAHAAGRTMSVAQNTDDTIAKAIAFAPLNSVAGQPFAVDSNWVKFGYSTRNANGFGRYQFSLRAKESVDNGTAQANSVAIAGAINLEMIVKAFPQFSTVGINTNSVSTQVDRDIALVLDRSGSMIWYKSEAKWDSVFDDLKNRGKISSSDRNKAKDGWALTHAYSPFTPYPTNNNDSFPNGNSNSNYYITSNVWAKLTADRYRNGDYTSVYEFIYDVAFVSNTRAPRHSRWAQLMNGVNAFFDVLDATDQEELVSLVTFSTSSQLDYSLAENYQPIRNYVANNYPTGSTAIGKGIQTAIPSIMTANSARPFAAKTIVILTDGENNVNPNPVSVVQDMMEQYNITVHTVTFSPGADQAAMQGVAAVGGGKHYHADEGDELVQIFDEIANNLPTILTE